MFSLLDSIPELKYNGGGFISYMFNFKRVLHAIFLFIIGPMNVENPKTEKVLMILNHVALSLSLGTMFIDTIKMVFVHHKELPYSPSPEL